MRSYLLILFIFISLSVFSQKSDTLPIVKWTTHIKKQNREDYLLTIKGEIKNGYCIGPPDKWDLGDWKMDQSMTQVVIIADSNWDVHPMVYDYALLTRPAKYKMHIRYYKDTVTYQFPHLVEYDTSINGKRHRIMVYDSIAGYHPKTTTVYRPRNETSYHADCQVTGTIYIKRLIHLSHSDYFNMVINAKGLPIPTHYVETRREVKVRHQKEKKLRKSYRNISLPERIHIYLLYDYKNNIYGSQLNPLLDNH